MEPTARSWTSYIQYPHGGDNFKYQVCGKLSGVTLYFLTFAGPSLGWRPSVCCRNCPTSTSSQATHCVSFISIVLRWGRPSQSLLFAGGNDEWYEPSGDPHCLPAGGFSVDMTHLLQKRSDLESAVISQSFLFSMDSIDSAWVSWNRFLQPRNHPTSELPAPHYLTCAMKKAYCKSLYSVLFTWWGWLRKRNGLSGNRTQSSFLSFTLRKVLITFHS